MQNIQFALFANIVTHNCEHSFTKFLNTIKSILKYY